MTARPRVRVGVVSWNTAELLDRCLRCLPAALGDLDASVVVVDNASIDGSAEAARRHPHCTVIENSENVGYAVAMNQALQHGPECDVLIALNPDTAPPPGSLAALVDRLVGNPRAGVVVPRLLNEDGSEQFSVYRFPSVAVALVVAFCPVMLLRRGVGQRFWLEGWSDHERRAEVDWGIGAVHVLRAAALAGRAPYDERWFMYAEDLELCWRLAGDGWRVRLEGDISIPHVANASGAQAWGRDRMVRWMIPTYQCYALVRGRGRARGWAAVNAVGLEWLRVKWHVLAALRPGRFAHLRTWAAEAGAPLAIHWRVVRRGVGALETLGGPTGPPTMGSTVAR